MCECGRDFTAAGCESPVPTSGGEWPASGRHFAGNEFGLVPLSDVGCRVSACVAGSLARVLGVLAATAAETLPEYAWRCHLAVLKMPLELCSGAVLSSCAQDMHAPSRV